MRFGHIAGDATLDLLNTVDWRLAEPDRSERLNTFFDVLDWCVESHLAVEEEAHFLQRLGRREPAAAERERQLVLDVRELAYRMLWTGVAEAGAELTDAYGEAMQHAALTQTDDHWSWRDHSLQLASPRHRITRALVDLARRDDLNQLRQCGDARCGWLYLDNSPRRNRRWCSPKDCGDRNRARAYYARKNGQQSRNA